MASSIEGSASPARSPARRSCRRDAAKGPALRALDDAPASFGLTSVLPCSAPDAEPVTNSSGRERLERLRIGGNRSRRPWAGVPLVHIAPGAIDGPSSNRPRRRLRQQCAAGTIASRNGALRPTPTLRKVAARCFLVRNSGSVPTVSVYSPVTDAASVPSGAALFSSERRALTMPITGRRNDTPGACRARSLESGLRLTPSHGPA